jgi:hypothetical protein
MYKYIYICIYIYIYKYICICIYIIGPCADDAVAAERLWDLSEILTGLKPSP